MTGKVPTRLSKYSGIMASICVEFINFVGIPMPSNRTTARVRNAVPSIIILKFLSPSKHDFGVIDVTEGNIKPWISVFGILGIGFVKLAW